MVMLDMFHLPERENKFNQNPFPHFLMLEKHEAPSLFRVLDPDYRWEGEIARDTVLRETPQASAIPTMVACPRASSSGRVWPSSCSTRCASPARMWWATTRAA